ncbi:MAG: hypothetical protein H6Q33_2713 [Deltaproteobacteria bacterium]|jgi:type II secretory pathway pseudopilin PulG|nr:hypothetical protein [Deltaproteobacteria bacterium]
MRRRRHSESSWRKALRDTAGFSLVEVLVSAGLLAIALTPVAYIQSGGLRGAVVSYNMLTANNLAVQLSDAVRFISYADPRLSSTSGQYVDPPGTLSNANPLASDGTTWSSCHGRSCGFTLKWKITDNTVLANTKQIEVQVTWNDYGAPRSYTLSTLKAIGS